MGTTAMVQSGSAQREQVMFSKHFSHSLTAVSPSRRANSKPGCGLLSVRRPAFVALGCALGMGLELDPSPPDL